MAATGQNRTGRDEKDRELPITPDKLSKFGVARFPPLGSDQTEIQTIVACDS